MPTKSTTAGKKVAAKKAAVTAAKTRGAANRRIQAQAKELRVTPASQWKSSKTEGMPLEVPSGNVALVRPVGIEAFLQKGLIPNSLREIALEAIQGKKAPQLKMTELSEEQIVNMMQLFDDVTVYCVVQPEVSSVPLDDDGKPIPYSERDEGPLYVDIVDLEDKMFIFQFACGGTRSVESFREEFARSVEHLSGEQDVEADA